MTKLTTKQIIEPHLKTLRGMNHGQLSQWGRLMGFDSASGFSNFKKSLLAAGIDYDAMRAGEVAERREEAAAAATATVMLFTDAKARTDRFAICDSTGEPVWYGKFFSGDRDYNGEQSSGEMAAAKKAVWLASQVAEAIGAKAIKLILNVDAEWLVWANEVAAGRDGGGKARALGLHAEKLNVVLRVQHVAGADNPADKFTVANGFMRWSERDLATLATFQH